MKVNELIILTEATFTPMNFPAEGNEEFAKSAVGTRTNYVAGKLNDDTGFPLAKNVKVVNAHGKSVRELEKGTPVFITRPGKLIRGRHLGLNNDTIFTGISLRSAGPKDVVGFVPVSSITKPAGMGQLRIAKGKEAQDNVASALKNKFPGLEITSSAIAGSQKGDVEATYNGKHIQFEIKGRNSKSSPITLFDKSARRGKRDEDLDSFALTITKGKFNSFEKMVDAFKKKDPTIGFPGDDGVNKSGKLPAAELRIIDPERLSQIKQDLLTHFAHSGDNYFAIDERSNEKISVYYTGYGDNPLKAPKFPDLAEFVLNTYGGASRGAMRVGVKIKLKPSKALELSPDIFNTSTDTPEEDTDK